MKIRKHLWWVGSFVIFSIMLMSQKAPSDQVVNLKLSLPQTSSLIYSLRYTTVLDAKTANELADLIVAQANDTTLNRPVQPHLPKNK